MIVLILSGMQQDGAESSCVVSLLEGSNVGLLSVRKETVLVEASVGNNTCYGRLVITLYSIRLA